MVVVIIVWLVTRAHVRRSCGGSEEGRGMAARGARHGLAVRRGFGGGGVGFGGCGVEGEGAVWAARGRRRGHGRSSL